MPVKFGVEQSVQYGLSFIKFHSSPASSAADSSCGVASKTETKTEVCKS
jgi:hypothetical protein